jgi:hypothetical protein
MIVGILGFREGNVITLCLGATKLMAQDAEGVVIGQSAFNIHICNYIIYIFIYTYIIYIHIYRYSVSLHSMYITYIYIII